MSQRVVTDIGNYIGSFVASDSNNFTGAWKEYLRVCVTIELDKPSKRRMKLKKNSENWCWVTFKYEAVPTFCFICGLIGHSEKYCEKIFDVPADQIEKPYGVWMRADPKCRNHTMGNKWLRHGGSFPVGSQAYKGDQRDKKDAIFTTVKKGSYLNKSGEGSDKVATVRQFSISENQAQDIQILITDTNSNYEAGREKDLEDENTRLTVTDPKRRRTNGPRKIGISVDENTTTEDENMLEDQEKDNSSSKNGIMAGAAGQARHAL